MLEELAPLTPVNFFQLRFSCAALDAKSSFPALKKTSKGGFLLPSTYALCHEESFADVYMGWSPEGIEVLVAAVRPFIRTSYPELGRGDSVELFIDTRDVKTSGYNTRFCHHFFFLPETVEGRDKGEITHFRTEDRHEWCDPELLQVKSKETLSGYELQIWIPRECLHGYDPEQFNRMGFAYRINRASGDPQHFSVVSEDYRIEEQPSLWSQCRLQKN